MEDNRMHSARKLFALTTLLVFGLGLAACESGPTPEELKAVHDAEAWAQIGQLKEALDGKRQELYVLKNPPEEMEGEEANTEDVSAEEGDSASEPPSPEELEAGIKAAQEEVYALTDEFAKSLIEFINSQGLVEGVELTGIQRAAFDLKGEEDILIAQEYIERGGDYQRAIDIYSTSLLGDPENEKLKEALDLAEKLRFMTEERFSVVKKGMSKDEVRELLGTPKASNVREFDKGVLGWFYPQEPSEERGRPAAGVYFQEEKDEYKVYRADFNAIKGGRKEV
jgi:hypothetical protein